MKIKTDYQRCPVCGNELEPAFPQALFDGEPEPNGVKFVSQFGHYDTHAGFLPCQKCAENKEIAENIRDYWKHIENGAER